MHILVPASQHVFVARCIHTPLVTSFTWATAARRSVKFFLGSTVRNGTTVLRSQWDIKKHT